LQIHPVFGENIEN